MTPDFEKPSGVPVLFADYATLMFDLQVIAFQADLTRVSTLMSAARAACGRIPRSACPIRTTRSPTIATTRSGSRR